MEDQSKIELKELIDNFRYHKQLLKDREEAFKIAQEQLIDALNSKGQKSATAEIDGSAIRVAIVLTERVVIDEDALKKQLGAKAFNKLTVAKLDKKKLEAAVSAQEIDPVVIAQCTSFPVNKPYVRITESKTDG